MAAMLLGIGATIAVLALAAGGVHLARTALVRRLHGARIESEVRALFGEQAKVTHVEIDSSWRLVLAAESLRIPGGLTLDARVARLRGMTRPDTIVLESLEGTLRWRGLEANVTFAAHAKTTAPVDGTLIAKGATWRPGAPPFDFEGTLRVARNDYTLVADRIVCDGATGSGTLQGTDGPPRTKLRFEGVGAALLTHLVALVGEHPLTIPAASKTQGDLEIDPDFTRRLDATLATATSRIAAAVRISSADQLDGSKVTGTLSFADANEARIFTARIKPEPAGDAALDLVARGPTNAWVLAGSTRAARESVVIPAHVPGPPLVLAATDAVCSIEVEQKGVRWSGFEGSFLGGRLRGSGALDAKGHTSDLSAEGVRIEDLPVGVAEPLLRGLASGNFSVRGQGDESSKLEGEGELELAEPEYVFLREASGHLQTFGLPAIPVRGASPLRTKVQLTGGRVLFRSLDGRVDGMRFGGDIELTWKGGLAGRIDAHLEERYLKKSLILAVPAMFTGQVTVPLRISGVVGTPIYEADLVGTIGKLVAQNSVTGAITGLVDGLLGNLLGGERRDSPAGPEDTGRDGGGPRRRKPRGGLGGLFDAFTG